MPAGEIPTEIYNESFGIFPHLQAVSNAGVFSLLFLTDLVFKWESRASWRN